MPTCPCGRRYRVRKDGRVPRHSPITGWRETPWCPNSEQPADSVPTPLNPAQPGRMEA